MSQFLRIFRIPELNWSVLSNLASRIERFGVTVLSESAVLDRPRVRGWRRILCLLHRDSRPVISSTGTILPFTVSLGIHEVPVFYNSLREAANAVEQEGAPFHYELAIRGELGNSPFSFTVTRKFNFLNGEESLIVSTYGGLEAESFYALTEFLGLRAEPCDRVC